MLGFVRAGMTGPNDDDDTMMKGRHMSNVIDLRTEAFADFMADYPYASEVDKLEDLPVQRFTADDNGEVFDARVIGFASSYKGESHLNHAAGTRPPGSCSKCRWTDTAILWAQPLEDAGEGRFMPLAPWQYVFATFGKSIVPGERQFNTVIWTDDPETVLRRLFVPTKDHFSRTTEAKAIPTHNAAAFRDAASVDTALAGLLERYGALIPEVERTDAEADPLAGL